MGRPRTQISEIQRLALDQLWEAQLALDAARQRRDELGRAAAAAACPWREIAASTAMSAQAAHKRFSTGAGSASQSHGSDRPGVDDGGQLSF